MFLAELISFALIALPSPPQSVKSAHISLQPGPSRLETPTLCDTGGCHNRDNKSFVGFARSDFALVRKKNAIEFGKFLELTTLSLWMDFCALIFIRIALATVDQGSCTTTRPA